MPTWITNTNPGSARRGQQYYVQAGTSSSGLFGDWHIYKDGTREFVQKPAPGLAAWGVPTLPAPAPVAPAPVAAAPAPAPVPPPSNGGYNGGIMETDAQAAASIAAQKPVVASSAPQPTTGGSSSGHNWITNTSAGSPHKGDQYYVQSGADSHGNPGDWHIYKDGSKEFVAKPTHIVAWGQAGDGHPGTALGATPAPAPAAPATKPPKDVNPQAWGQPGGPNFNNSNSAGASTPASSPPKPTHIVAWGQAGDGHPGTALGPAPANVGDAPAAKPPKATNPQAWGQSGGPNWESSNGPASSASSDGPHLDPVTGGALAPDSTAPAPISSPAAKAKPGASSGKQNDGSVQVGGAVPQDQSASALTPEEIGASYTVVHGDTLWDIAKEHHMPLSKLEEINPQIKNPDLILPGQKVNLGGAATEVATPVEFPTTSTYKTSSSAGQPEAKTAQKIGGWSDGTSGVPSDPTKGIIEGAGQVVRTDPLKINDKKHLA